MIFLKMTCNTKKPGTSKYQVISRAALSGLPFSASDKDSLQALIQHFSRIYFTDIIVRTSGPPLQTNRSISYSISAPC